MTKTTYTESHIKNNKVTVQISVQALVQPKNKLMNKREAPWRVQLCRIIYIFDSFNSSNLSTLSQDICTHIDHCLENQGSRYDSFCCFCCTGEEKRALKVIRL